MRILAVDYGDARTGLAVSDNSEILASPVCTITEYNAEKLAAKVADAAKEQGAGEIIVGLPLNMDGSRGSRAEKCEGFAEMLRGLVDVEVRMWDERSTTVTAYRYLDNTNVYGKKRKAVVDTVAATIILESYLSYRSKQKQKSEE